MKRESIKRIAIEKMKIFWKLKNSIIKTPVVNLTNSLDHVENRVSWLEDKLEKSRLHGKYQ